MKHLSILIFSFFNILIFTSSCSDFFEQESDHLIYADKEHLNNWSDTVFSITGILGQLQNIADRTVLLGEVRGDLVTLTDNASADLRQLATFSVTDDNAYNHPSDYYAVINNCNYYIAHADTALKSNRNEYIFMKEYIAVKAIRAWTYLQLALNYGSVPFVTEPVLTKEASEQDYPRYELAQVCQYFIDDLAGLPDNYLTQYPGVGSTYYYFPVDLVRGDLYLWLGSTKGRDGGKSDFEKAALAYYSFITNRNTNSYYATSSDCVMWTSRGATYSWLRPSGTGDYNNMTFARTVGSQAELITGVESNSSPSQGYYSELPELFVSTSDNDYEVSITPSQRIIELSEAQANCVVSTNLGNVIVAYAPSGLDDNMSGDLRLSTVWSTINITYNNTRIEAQSISKYLYRYVRLYRRTMVYLRMAEALNLAGHPRLAYKILERGLNNKVIQEEVNPFLSESDSTWVATNINLPSTDTFYSIVEVEDFSTGYSSNNTLGIHSRGSGWTPLNEYYRLDGEGDSCLVMQPDSTFAFNDTRYEQLKQRQQEQVDSLILNEEALEFAFEGLRYYDLMRFAMRSDNPGQFMTTYINRRNGEDSDAGLNLSDPHSWYLRWGNGKIGY